MLHSYACPDCGANPINHRVARTEVALETFLDKVFAPLDRLRRGLEILLARLRLELLIPPIVTLLSWLGLAKKLRQPQHVDTDRTRVLWQAAKARHIELYHVALFGHPTSIFVAKYEGKTIVYTHEPRPSGPPSASYDWMDNKSVMINKFQAAGIPVPKGGACRNRQEALEIFHNIKGGLSLSRLLVHAAGILPLISLLTRNSFMLSMWLRKFRLGLLSSNNWKDWFTEPLSLAAKSWECCAGSRPMSLATASTV